MPSENESHQGRRHDDRVGELLARGTPCHQSRESSSSIPEEKNEEANIEFSSMHDAGARSRISGYFYW